MCQTRTATVTATPLQRQALAAMRRASRSRQARASESAPPARKSTIASIRRWVWPVVGIARGSVPVGRLLYVLAGVALPEPGPEAVDAGGLEDVHGLRGGHGAKDGAAGAGAVGVDRPRAKRLHGTGHFGPAGV